MNKFLIIFTCCLSWANWLSAQDSPAITNITSTGAQKTIKWTPFPAIKSYQVLSSTNIVGPFTNATGVVAGFGWTGTSSLPANFYTLQVTPMTSNEVLTATVLNRLAYGPTPDELKRVLTGPQPIGPDAYITEQLAPELINETVGNSHTNINFIETKFAGITDVIPAASTNYATIADLRAWHVLRAVGAKRQLLEILLQFFENHFVTQYEKSQDYFDPFYDNNINEPRIATQFEYLENTKWRNALLQPSCTFYDLLKISAESPAQIIYLDTVTSKGNGNNIANENYARELLELFTFGVDNGYSQADITALSRSWTGWTLQIVSPENALNPFAPRTTNLLASSIAQGMTNINTVSNLHGVWAFNFNATSHDTTRSKSLFINSFVPGRFGPPYTTKLYGTNTVPGRYNLGIPNTRPGDVTNRILAGYDVISFLADLPFTQEYLSVKLCRLFIHDDFPNPTTDTNSPDYDFYNYAAGNLTPEAQLVRQCMLAWENSSPKGQIRPVLETIFASDLFRSQHGSLQKIKTPLEYTVSAIRALRSSINGSFMPGTFTSDTDGFDLIGTTGPIPRMGSMSLFDRAEPNGYAEDGPPWISAGTLNERIRFVQAFMMITGQPNYTNPVKDDAGRDTLCFPVSLIINNLPLTSRTNAAAVADYFLSIIYPGEGAANLDLYRTMAINFLNNGSADLSPNSFPFGILQVSSTANSSYDIRVRGMVGLLLSLQRFHEQ